MLRDLQNKLIEMLEHIEQFVRHKELSEPEKNQKQAVLRQASMIQKKEFLNNRQKKAAEAEKLANELKQEEAQRKQMMTFSREG
jgi:hypothetical protein